MTCPRCSTQLLMTDRQGVEIDYCPSCRGIWLDRGELDKIVERSAGFAPEGQGRDNGNRFQDAFKRHDDDDDDRSHQQGKNRRRGGFLGDLFDF